MSASSMSTDAESIALIRSRAEALIEALQIDASTIYNVLPHLAPSAPHYDMASHQQIVKDQPIVNFIDHTVLKPEATLKEMEKLCEEAKANKFAAVCVNGCRVGACKRFLEGTSVKVATVVGFPLGADEFIVKQTATTTAIENGAEEIDMVLNVGKLKDGDYHYVHKDISHVCKAAHGARDHKRVVKVILETCLLTREEIIDACILSVYSGADFVKTSTGFSKGGAKLEDVRLMKLTVGDKALVKASGGVRSYEDAFNYIQNGASRIGTSSGVEISKGQVVKGGY